MISVNRNQAGIALARVYEGPLPADGVSGWIFSIARESKGFYMWGKDWPGNISLAPASTLEEAIAAAVATWRMQ